MDEINVLMDEEIKHQLRGLKDLKPGSADQTAAVKNLTALYESRINEEKVRTDAEDKRERREMERAQQKADADSKAIDFQLREDQVKDQKTDRLVRVGITLVEIGLPLVCYGHWFKKGLKFEETGSITSSMMRNLINKFKPKR